MVHPNLWIPSKGSEGGTHYFSRPCLVYVKYVYHVYVSCLLPVRERVTRRYSPDINGYSLVVESLRREIALHQTINGTRNS